MLYPDIVCTLVLVTRQQWRTSFHIIFIQDRYAVRFIDYGHLEYLPSSELLPVEGSHAVFDGWSPQAVRCCLFESPAEDTNYEARWLFNSAVKDTEVHCTFGKKVR